MIIIIKTLLFKFFFFFSMPKSNNRPYGPLIHKTMHDRKFIIIVCPCFFFKAPGLDDRSTTAYTEYVQAVAFNICAS